MAYVARDFVPNGTRKIRANGQQSVGSFTRGNANSSFLGREYTPGLLAAVSNSPLKKGAVYRGPRRAATVVDPRRGRVCPACGIERSVANKCECNS